MNVCTPNHRGHSKNFSVDTLLQLQVIIQTLQLSSTNIKFSAVLLIAVVMVILSLKPIQYRKHFLCNQCIEDLSRIWKRIKLVEQNYNSSVTFVNILICFVIIRNHTHFPEI